jgi:hypothetical protein
MSRPILTLWPYLWRAFVPVVLLTVPAALPGPSFLSICSALALLLLCGWRFRWLWRLTTRVRQFQTTSEGRIVLHYAPELNTKWNMSTLLERVQAELDRLTERFGFPLWGQVVVFLFPSHKDIGKIFGKRYGAVALYFGLPHEWWTPS